MDKLQNTTNKRQAPGGRSSLPRSLAARAWPPVIVWLGLIFILSAIPGSAYPKVHLPGASYAVHLFLYTILGLFLLRALRRQFPRLSVAGLIGLTVAFGFFWAVSDEWHQERFVANRTWENLDLVTDAVGLAVGAAAYYGLRALFLRRWPEWTERWS